MYIYLYAPKVPIYSFIQKFHFSYFSLKSRQPTKWERMFAKKDL